MSDFIIPRVDKPMEAEDSRTQLASIRTELRDIKAALSGDAFGNAGIVGSIKTINDNLKTHTVDDNIRFDTASKEVALLGRKLVYITGVMAGIMIALEIYHKTH